MRKLNLNWVTDVIKDDYKKWKCGDVIKIETQTGTGKSAFIVGTKDKTVKGIVDRLKDEDKLIYICNRLELKRQIKIDLMKKWDITIPDDVEELDNITTIKNVTVTSYHAIAYRELESTYKTYNNNLDKYKYIVCDECHYFLTDSSFNNKTYLALNNLIFKQHKNSIKIFISATMDEISNAIEVSATKDSDETCVKSNVYYYSTSKDYSYLNVKYYKSIKTIQNLIKNDNTENKWLVFVSSKSKGTEIKKALLEGGITAEFIYANAKNKEKELIRLNSKFNCKVLITTKALDNGVNIKDELVKNIVVESWDKTTFLQEIGRLRFNINNAPTINLFIPTFNSKVFRTKIDKCYKPKISDLELFDKDYREFCKKYDNNISKIDEEIFYLSSNAEHKWTVNLAGSVRLYKDNNFAEYMLAKFKEDKQFAYVKEQLKWLELEDTFDEENLIDNVVDVVEVKKLEQFLENMTNKRLYDEEQQILSDLIIKELTTISKNVDYRTKKLKPKTLETILREQLCLNYAVSEVKREDKMVDGKRVRKRYITIIKL